MALNANEVKQLYVAYLGRGADAEGLAYWTTQVPETFTLHDLRWSLVNAQPEYQELYGGLDREGVVTAIYQNMFGREPDAEGLEYWVNGEGSVVPIEELMQLFITAASPADRAAFDARVEELNPEPGVPGETYLLTPNADRIEGTDNDDLFEAPISTINFVNGNTLNTGDVLDGGAGNDTLRAELINDSFSQSGLGAVRPNTQNIENVEITALRTTESGTVTLDAANMYDVQHIGSYNSNASLVIQDLHTKTSGGSVRNTDAITIRMDHTQNVNSNGHPSDLVVLFDENYLLSGQDAEGRALYWLLDQDADLEGAPLLDNINVDGIRFSIDGGETITLSSPDAMAADTHVEFVAALQAQLNQLIADGVVPAGTTLTVNTDQSRTTFLDDGSVSSPVPAIVLTTGNGAPVTPVGFRFVEDEPGDFNLWARTDQTFGVEDLPVTSNIELHKVGRGSEGGDLIVGGKSQSATSSGVEVFNVTVMGDSSKPSHVGVLNSTNGDLRTVNVTTDAAVTGDNGYADLIIGNLGGASGPYAATDVQNFNSTTFQGNLTLYTELNESGNGAHVYNLGGGNDTLVIDFGTGLSGLAGVFGGIAGDSLAISTGEGNDTIILNGVGEDENVDLETMVVNAGNGDNTVYFNVHNDNLLTAGEGARIVSGTGNDAIFLNGQHAANAGWEVLVDGDNTPSSLQLFAGKLKIDVGGVESLWVDIGYNNSTYTTSRADIREAIIAAIESNTALANMVEVRQRTDGALELRSLANGDHEVNVQINGPVASTSAIANTDANADATSGAGWELLNNQPHVNTVSLSQLQSAYNAWFPGSTGNVTTNTNMGSSGFDGADGMLEAMNDAAELVATDINADNVVLAGPTTAAQDSNVINSGAGNDLIVLIDEDEYCLNFGTGNVVEMTASNFGTNTIVNFTLGDTTTTGNLDDNDILDFTSYLDGAAAARASSVGNQNARVNEAVDFSFQNHTGGTFAGTEIDHNSMHMVDFSEIWNLLDSPDIGTPANFASLTAAHLQSFFQGNNTVTGAFGAGDFTTGSGTGTQTAQGNNFLVFVGKNGDVTVDTDGTLSFDNAGTGTAEDLGMFKVFEGTVTAYDGGAVTYSVSFAERGTIDLAGVDLNDLTVDHFGIA